MKAFVDENTCICCGLCEGICSEVFTTDTGVAVAGEVSADNEEKEKRYGKYLFM
ncbi:ferredoxin [Clostridium butyricum]|uniref:Ferredoxin n=1 Tax=Clostridium butyricum TaxID=1492 RepID=A0A6L9ET27_CLOBU|nr:ferredoxin [Clostridium butyricum]